MISPIYMDVMALYFAILPFLFAFTIYLAIKKKYKLHFQTQTILLALSLLIILYFEVSARIFGGFMMYAQHSTLSFEFLVVYLVIHIILATASLGGWVYLYIVSFKAYKNNKLEDIINSKHKKIGKAIFLSMSLSSYMGVLLYLFLFVF